MEIITIPGKPMGKGRPRFGQGFTYTPKKTVEYENLVRFAWMQNGCKKLNGNIAMDIQALFLIPKSVSKKKREQMDGAWCPHKPDADNIGKIICDALNGGIAYDDDAQVVCLTVTKRYTATEPRVIVTLREEQ